jgi:DNA-binding transcriptional MocR family regulator
VLTRPGDVVLVDSPTYHLAMRVIADHHVDVVGAPADADGIDPDGTAALLRRIRASGRRVPMLYLVPTFANPTGDCLPDDRRSALVQVAARTGTVVLEDDTYRELAYEAPAPPSLWSLADGAGVVRIGSFSKTVAPGLRLGFLTGSQSFVETLVQRGVVDSGGGVNHTTAVAMAAFGESGDYDRHLLGVLAGYRAQRDALTAALRDRLPAAPFRIPGGGWFVWLRLPDRITATRLLGPAERNGVSFLPGPLFYVRAGADRDADRHRVADERLRLSFSVYAPPDLVTGVSRLAAALDQVTAENR